MFSLSISLSLKSMKMSLCEDLKREREKKKAIWKLVGGWRQRMGWSHTHVCRIKIRRNIWFAELPPEEWGVSTPHQTYPRVLMLGREVPITSGCENQCELRLKEMVGFWDPRQFLLKGPCMNLLRLTSSELQCWGSRLKGTRDIRGKLNYLIWGWGLWGGSFLPERSAGRGHYSFAEPPPNRASSRMPYLRLHQPGSQC